MRILALEPYYGGSHQAVLDGWARRSRHAWTVLTLTPRKWKWRMRHAAVTFAGQVAEQAATGAEWDLVICSDMLNLAEFLGLAPPAVRRLPSLIYFHENQVTYPVEHESEFDYHFAFSNLAAALAATRVWFNSRFHQDSFLDGLRRFLRRMPDNRPLDTLDAIREKARIRPPGLEPFPPRGARQPGPMRVIWAARWEYDKGPEIFFGALRRLAAGKTDFRVSVIGGGRARRTPPVFASAKRQLARRIDLWGYLDDREAYANALAQADVAVSTAQHEFFGIGVAEAVAAGAFPVVPRRLAYPEMLGEGEAEGKETFFYDGTERALARRLTRLSRLVSDGDLWQHDPERGRRVVARYAWERTAPAWDDEARELAEAGQND